jgi:hypothetical protein
MNTNNENPKVGKAFQEMVCRGLEDYFCTYFDMEVPLPIGKPAKDHRFDCVSEDRKIVVECKAYTWTDSGNVPSAKLMGMNEALFYMSYLPDDATKILCIKKATHPKRTETLAEYYNRVDGHLFRDVKIFGVDDLGRLNVIKG